MPKRTSATTRPPARPTTERIRTLGQVWTPDWVADAMAAYVLAAEDVREVFDPAVGAGALLRSAARHAVAMGRPIRLAGAELDATVLPAGDLVADAIRAGTTVGDYLTLPERPHRAIIANPPYLRHHRIGPETKAMARKLATRLIGRPLDARAGLHVYFLLRSLAELAPGGRLAYIMPADTCEGVFAPRLWQWIVSAYRLDAVVTFRPEATPFPTADTNAVVFLITKATPVAEMTWVECLRADGSALREVMGEPDRAAAGGSMRVLRRPVAEAVATGLSRGPELSADAASPYSLGDFAACMRGIAAGANEFFYLTRAAAAAAGLPDAALRPSVVRTRDVQGADLTEADLAALEARGRPTRLLYLPKVRELPADPAIAKYVAAGEDAGYGKRALCGARNPWWAVERREPPAFLFAYLGRRNARFIRNHARAIPSHAFLCVYPRAQDDLFVGALERVLAHPDIGRNLRLVGKSYGGGAVKVEPRALARLPLPASAVEAEPVLLRYLAERAAAGSAT